VLDETVALERKNLLIRYEDVKVLRRALGALPSFYRAVLELAISAVFVIAKLQKR